MNFALSLSSLLHMSVETLFLPQATADQITWGMLQYNGVYIEVF